MNADDLEFVAETHRRHLTGGFVRLGDSFLRSYYHSFIASPASVALIAEVGNRRAGFLVGTVDHAQHTRHVGRHHRRRLLAAGGAALLRRPGIAGQLVTTRLGRYTSALQRARRPVVSAERTEQIGVLSALAVDTPPGDAARVELWSSRTRESPCSTAPPASS